MSFRNYREQGPLIDNQMIAKRPCILIAEDDNEMRRLLVWSFKQENYETVECGTGIHLLDYLSPYLGAPFDSSTRKKIDLIVSDIRMPGVTGLEILEGMNQCADFPPMILITAFGDEETHMFAERMGAAAIFDKPFDIDDLLAKAGKILRA